MQLASRRCVHFLVGSQPLYGEEDLEQVHTNARKVAAHLSEELPVDVRYGNVLATPADVARACIEADADPNCVGVVVWAHTFSPSMMWIPALQGLKVPALHLHTQYGTDIPSDINMGFMNQHQAAHGDRELAFGFGAAGKERAIIVGHWEDDDVVEEIEAWVRAAFGWCALRSTSVAQIGDKMRDVGVTDGNRVTGLVQLGVMVGGHAIGDVVALMPQVSEQAVSDLVARYRDEYRIEPSLLADGDSMARVQEAAAIELALQRFLAETGCNAFTSSFQDLHGLPQLPGLAAQRLMARGFGYGPEGDWKVATMVRVVKEMGAGLERGGGTLMEYYTYDDFDTDSPSVLGAHMLEICPTVAGSEKPSLVVAPLSIGGKGDPARLVFTADSGQAINVSLVEVPGGRLRLIVNEVQVTPPSLEMPNLPVARAYWEPEPNLKVEAAAWMMAGGAHHTAFSQQVGINHMRHLARMLNIELVVIDEHTDIVAFERELMVMDAVWRLRMLGN